MEEAMGNYYKGEKLLFVSEFYKDCIIIAGRSILAHD